MMRVLFHNLPQKNICCHKPYKHQMPTLKRRSDILFSEHEQLSECINRERLELHITSWKYNKCIYTEDNLAKLSTKYIQSVTDFISWMITVSLKLYIIFGHPKESYWWTWFVRVAVQQVRQIKHELFNPLWPKHWQMPIFYLRKWPFQKRQQQTDMVISFRIT